MITQDESFATERDKSPISAHPLFPAIVALWFAALLGFGSLVLPDVVLERLVNALGLPDIIPSAAAPLGSTAHGLIAAVAALGGACLGYLLAWQVARAQRNSLAQRVEEDEASNDVAATPRRRRPIAAHKELGADGFDVEGTDYSATHGHVLTASLDENSANGLSLHPFDEAEAALTDEPENPQGIFEIETNQVAEDAADTEDGFTYHPFTEAGADAAEYGVTTDYLAGKAELIDDDTVHASLAPGDEPFTNAEIDSAAELASAPLSHLSLDELTQRLALSIAQRRAQAAARKEAEEEAHGLQLHTFQMIDEPPATPGSAAEAREAFFSDEAIEAVQDHRNVGEDDADMGGLHSFFSEVTETSDSDDSATPENFEEQDDSAQRANGNVFAFENGNAAPRSDNQSVREQSGITRPFDPPRENSVADAKNAATRSDQEQALREALRKLQRVS
ncbi:hypothetical protein [Altericroceibacterium endophyticum]|uniref:Uncharacterized protein n=1 Tax=Altericroceibacterium endophyticum TaxID=1808508 RepID=A0A6I4T5X7_9SPHN|nr:hypothetical protein [Altericroceibacterium endophyticum]MXO65819.1 hypothetical protein [Altericroceibacterium endophyticum]